MRATDLKYRSILYATHPGLELIIFYKLFPGEAVNISFVLNMKLI